MVRLPLGLDTGSLVGYYHSIFKIRWWHAESRPVALWIMPWIPHRLFLRRRLTLFNRLGRPSYSLAARLSLAITSLCYKGPRVRLNRVVRDLRGRAIKLARLPRRLALDVRRALWPLSLGLIRRIFLARLRMEAARADRA